VLVLVRCSGKGANAGIDNQARVGHGVTADLEQVTARNSM